MTRWAQRSEDLGHQRIAVAHQGAQEPFVGASVLATNRFARLGHGAVQDHSAPVVQRVGQGHVGMHQLEPVLG